jgi:N-methylhydantoinase A
MFREMRDYAEAIVRLAEPQAELVEQRTAFMRYRGQGHEIPVTLPARPFAQGDERLLATLFEEKYRQLFGRTIPGLTQEVISWSLSLGVPAPLPRQSEEAPPAGPAEPAALRRIYDSRLGRFLEFGVYPRSTLRPGATVQGPAVIVEDETTTVVSASFDAHVDGNGYIRLTKRG